MKKIGCLLLIGLFSLLICYAGEGEAETPKPYVAEKVKEIQMGKTPSGFNYVLYSENEFKPWQHKLRRGETLFFGGVPVMFMFVSIFDSLVGTNLEFWPMMGISAGLSAAISLTDFILGEVSAD